MTALSIGVTTRDFEIVGHGLPSGRGNLRGQQVSDRIIAARQNRDDALREYDKAIEAYSRQEINIDTLLAFRRVYDLAESWLIYMLASDNYSKSIVMLQDGEITLENQRGIFNNMIEAGTAFRRM